MKKGILLASTLAFLMPKGGAISVLGRNNYNAQDLENEARGLSNFGGYSGYTGEGDDFLEFSGEASGSFMQSIHKGKVYTVTLTNASTTVTKTALLCPGLIPNPTGLIADGAFNATDGASGLTAVGNPRPIIYLNNFIRNYPTLVAGFKISCSNITQFECVLTVQKESPFGQHESKIINPALYASEANPNTTLITVGEPFYMDNQTIVSYQVLPSTTVNIGLIFGASLNIAKALKSKATKAQTTVKAVASFSGR